MTRTIGGVVLASLAIYVWGYVYWEVSPYRTLVWKQASDELAARDALRKYFPENGTYCVPGFAQDRAAVEGEFEQGPVAFVDMVAVNGRPLVEPSILAKGLALNVVIVLLMTLLVRHVRAALPTFGGRAKLVVLAGLIAAVAIDGGDIVWWQISWPWKLYQAGYDFSVWLIAGLIMAAFVGRPKA